MADLCADGSRLPVYWCSFYSPCQALFFPVFLEGTLPEVLARGTEQATQDSPWWRFLHLAHLTRQDAPGRVEAVRNLWLELESELVASAYPLAADAKVMIDAGDGAAARKRLTEYMSHTVDRMLAAVEELIARFSAASVAAG